MMTMCAHDRGWETFQPVSLPQWDVCQEHQREEVWRYLQEVDPDMIMIAPECTAWSWLQNWSQRTPLQCRELQRKKREGRKLLKLTEELVSCQLARRP